MKRKKFLHGISVLLCLGAVLMLFRITPLRAAPEEETVTPESLATPHLAILTPPGISDEIAPVTPAPTDGAGQASAEALNSAEAAKQTAQPTREAFVEQVEVDVGFRFSDFLQILCYVVYGLAAALLFLGIVRALFLLVLHRELYPSRKERQRRKAEKERKKPIDTDIKPEDHDVRQDTWNS